VHSDRDSIVIVAALAENSDKELHSLIDVTEKTRRPHRRC